MKQPTGFAFACKGTEVEGNY